MQQHANYKTENGPVQIYIHSVHLVLQLFKDTANGDGISLNSTQN